jgi:hypothetical protein
LSSCPSFLKFKLPRSFFIYNFSHILSFVLRNFYAGDAYFEFGKGVEVVPDIPVALTRDLYDHDACLQATRQEPGGVLGGSRAEFWKTISRAVMATDCAPSKAALKTSGKRPSGQLAPTVQSASIRDREREKDCVRNA